MIVEADHRPASDLFPVSDGQDVVPGMIDPGPDFGELAAPPLDSDRREQFAPPLECLHRARLPDSVLVFGGGRAFNPR